MQLRPNKVRFTFPCALLTGETKTTLDIYVTWLAATSATTPTEALGVFYF